MIAFIPARSGSKRIKNKNIIKIGGHPLIAYTVRYAKKVKSFDKVFCITDSKKYLNLAKKYGADDFILRPKNISGEKSSDIDWIKWAINICKKKNKVYKVIEKCHYGEAGVLSNSLSSLSSEELKTKGKLVRRLAQEVCLSLRQLEEIPDSGIHSCSFYSQIAKKGRRKGKRVICMNFSCTPSGYTMDDTCLNFKLR